MRLALFPVTPLIFLSLSRLPAQQFLYGEGLDALVYVPSQLQPLPPDGARFFGGESAPVVRVLEHRLRYGRKARERQKKNIREEEPTTQVASTGLDDSTMHASQRIILPRGKYGDGPSTKQEGPKFGDDLATVPSPCQRDRPRELEAASFLLVHPFFTREENERKRDACARGS